MKNNQIVKPLLKYFLGVIYYVNECFNIDGKIM